MAGDPLAGSYVSGGSRRDQHCSAQAPEAPGAPQPAEAKIGLTFFSVL